MNAPTDQTTLENDAPLPLIPAPRSQQWDPAGKNEWVTDDPFAHVRMGINADLPVMEYAVSINHAGASITAGSEAALADGRNAFAQIVHVARVRQTASATETDNDELRIPGVRISDAPAHPWRGLMVDVARHFLPLSDLRTLIDAMAVYRLNVLHLHLTDDQGWRFEVRGYPKLTDVGAWRERTVEGVPKFDGTDTFAEDRHGGYYTQEDLRELVKYAKDRGVMIVPEVSVPGHVQAAIAAYPQLGNFPHKQLLVRETWGESQHVLGTNEAAFQFVRDVYEQLADTFEGPFVHIGGDEVPLTEWESAPEARSQRQEWGYTRESEILGRFTDMAAATVKNRGKRVIAWDSAHLVRLPDDTLVMHRGDAKSLATVAGRGFQVVAASDDDLGLDHVQGLEEPVGATPPLTLKDVYTRPLIPAKLGSGSENLVLGIHAHASREYIPNGTHLQYMLFPRLIAVAQRAWGAADLSYEEFEEALYVHEGVLDLLGVESRKVGV